MLNEVKALSEFSPDYRSVLAALSSILHRVALEQVVPNSADNAIGDQQKIQYYAKNVCAEDIQLFYQIALTSRQDLHITPDTKSGFEMALLRMLAFQMSPVPVDKQTPFESRPYTDNEDAVPDQIQQTEDASLEKMAENVAQTEIASRPEAVDNQESEKAELTETEQNHDTISIADQAELAPEPEKKTLNNVVDPDSVGSEPIDSGSVAWNTEVIELGLSGMTLNFMLNSVVELSAPQISVFVESGHFRLFNDNHEKRIREALLTYYSGCSDVEFVEGLKEGQETPMMWRERKLQEKKAFAKELIFNDSYVQEILDQFQGALIEQSIQPEV